MKNLLLTTIFLITASHANAQNNETQNNEIVYFYPKQECIDLILAFQNTKEYGEDLLFTGTGIQQDIQGTTYSSNMFFFVNQDSGTWVLLNTYQDGKTCLVNSGFGFTPYVGNQFGER
jgi:hypothetical protein